MSDVRTLSSLGRYDIVFCYGNTPESEQKYSLFSLEDAIDTGVSIFKVSEKRAPYINRVWLAQRVGKHNIVEVKAVGEFFGIGDIDRSLAAVSFPDLRRKAKEMGFDRVVMLHDVKRIEPFLLDVQGNQNRTKYVNKQAVDELAKDEESKKPIIEDLISDLSIAQETLLQVKKECGYAMSAYQMKLAILSFMTWMQSHPVYDDQEQLRKEAVLILKQFSFRI